MLVLQVLTTGVSLSKRNLLRESTYRPLKQWATFEP